MSFLLTEEVSGLLHELIKRISGLSDGPAFKHVEKNVHTHLRNADSMYFVKEKEIDRIVDSLSSKFAFHGYAPQGRDLLYFYNKLKSQDLPEHARDSRLSIIKFILMLSDSPTNNIQKHTYSRNYEKGDQGDVIDWPSYLKEGIPRWSPPVDDDDSSDFWSDGSADIEPSAEPKPATNATDCEQHKIICPISVYAEWVPDYRRLRQDLASRIQSEWFVRDRIHHKPSSGDYDANVAFIWDGFIHHLTKGLIPKESSVIISEYKVMREVIWQLYEPHTSLCFHFIGNSLVPKSDTTISSIRLKPFESFLHEFAPYIEWMQMFREFQGSLTRNIGRGPPDTYQSYNYALQTVIRPIYASLMEIENRIKQQETTCTLLTLAHELKPLFGKVRLLKDIHCKVVLDFRKNSSLCCATTLLHRLQKGLLSASSKLEQDLYLSLYLHSLYKYFAIIHSWLNRDVLDDAKGEFVIADLNLQEPHVLNQVARSPLSVHGSASEQRSEDWQMQFVVKEVEEDVQSDAVIAVFCNHVLQIGKNVHLLRLLGKLHLIPEFTTQEKDTLYDMYTTRVMRSIAAYFDESGAEKPPEDCLVEPPASPSFVFPATCIDDCKYLTEMDQLENLVDISNGFLVKAFESYFIRKPEVKLAAEESLFERVSKLTQRLFPAHHILEQVLIELLKERYSISGLTVKNVLMQDFALKQQFSFLKHVFVFDEDLIFPFYRRIFQQLDDNRVWGNHAWLTSYLHDIIMDLYPNFYQSCYVEVGENWYTSRDDPLKACSVIALHYSINWPLNIIIRTEHLQMYRDLFQFVLKIKWALYTINHLHFTELEPKGRPAKNQEKALRKVIAKLKILRFGFVNVFSSIQHYILGHVYSKLSRKFDEALTESYDLQSLIEAHANFVQSLHKACMEFHEFKAQDYGFQLLLYLVRKLRLMWRNFKEVSDVDLEKCERCYLLCHKNINPIINPSDYHRYITQE